jgi:serine/threonine protein kinase
VADSGETRVAARLQGPGPGSTSTRASDSHLSIEGYEDLRELQRGGQGIVFQAVQRSTKRAVAIKVLRNLLLRTYQKEIDLLRRMNELSPASE